MSKAGFAQVSNGMRTGEKKTDDQRVEVEVGDRRMRKERHP